jgi:coenzyme F420-reducing hydrogenase gamma subunit
VPTTTNDLHERQTRMFIDQAPTHLVLRRKNAVDDGAGGVKVTAETDLDPQLCRLVGQKATASRVSDAGRQVPVDMAVVGLPSLDIQVKDTFTDIMTGYEYEVLTVRLRPTWDITAMAVRRG